MAGLFEILGQAGAYQALPDRYNPDLNVAAKAAAPKPNFFANVAHSAASIAGAAAHGVVDPVVNAAVGLGHDVTGNLAVRSSQNNLDSRNKQMQQAQDKLIGDYKGQKITKDQYTAGLRNLQASGQQLHADAAKVANMHRSGYGETASHVAPLVGTALTLAAPFAEAGAGALAGVRGAQVAAKAIDSTAGVGKAIGASKDIIGRTAAVGGKLVRNALVTQPIIATPGNVINDVKTKNYGDLALQAGAIAAPGLVKGAGLLSSKLGPEIKTAFFGKQGFFDAVKSAGGPDLLSHLDSLSGNAAKTTENLLRVVSRYNLDQFNGDAKAAGSHFVEYLQNHGKDPATMSPQQIVKNLKDWVGANKTFTDMHKAGELLTAPNGKLTQDVLKPGQRIIAGRFNQNDAKSLVAALDGTTNFAGREAVLNRMAAAGADWAKNPHVEAQIRDAIINDANYAKNIRGVGTTRALFNTTGKKVAGGYFPTISSNARADFKSAKEAGAIVRGKEANPVLGKVGDFITKAGLSPTATSGRRTAQILRIQFADKLEQQGVKGDAKAIMNKLRNAEVAGATSPTMLNKRQVQAALATDAATAGKVLKAVRQAYSALPAEQVGAGGKVLNKAIEKAPLLGSYIRTEQNMRYEQPFFSLPFRVKQVVKSGLVSLAKGATPGIKVSADDARVMRAHGFFDAGGARAGSDATLSDTIGPGGGKGKLVNPEIEHILSKLGASIAQKNNTTVRQIMEMPADAPLRKQFEQSLKLTTGYGDGGYLNSPLAKTLNLLIFPSRFETKVATVAAKAFAHAPVATQFAVTQGLANTTNFLGSPEGKQWQKDNSELIGLVKAFTPVGTIDNFHNFLYKGHHIGDLGEIGGLPVGVLGTILDHQGINLGKLGTSQYTDPKTGQPVPNKIPQTTLARMQQGMTDLLGSMFSYSGKNAGLTSKTKIIQDVVPFTKPNPKEVKAEFKNGTTAPAEVSAAKPRQYIPVTKGNIPAIKKVEIAPIYSAKKGRAGKPKIYAKKYGQPL